MNITEETNDVLAVKPFDNQLKASPELHPSLPQHPFCTMMVAPAGGGKTTTILRMIYGNKKPKNHTGKHKHYKFYRHFFDRIYVFSPSWENDAKCSICKIPSEQIFEDVDIYDEVLQEILDTQEESIREDGKENTDKVLLVFSDLAGSKFFFLRNAKGHFLKYALIGDIIMCRLFWIPRHCDKLVRAFAIIWVVWCCSVGLATNSSWTKYVLSIWECSTKKMRWGS